MTTTNNGAAEMTATETPIDRHDFTNDTQRTGYGGGQDMTTITIEQAERVAERWRERVWGSDRQGAEHIVAYGGGIYMITEGTGDGVYAYLVSDVAAWLDDDDGMDGDEWLVHLRETDDTDYSQAPYQRFCQQGLPETGDGLVRHVWRELGLALCDGGSEIISRDELPAECATEEEVDEAVASWLEIDPKRVTSRVDVDAHGAAYWTATIDGREGAAERHEVAATVGLVTVQIGGSEHVYALITNRGTDRARAIEVWTDARDAGDPGLREDAAARCEAHGGFAEVTWVSVDGCCEEGDVLDVSSDGAATVVDRV